MSKVLNQVGESYLVEMAVSTCICIIKATYLGTAPSMAVTEQGSVAAALWLTQALVVPGAGPAPPVLWWAVAVMA